MPSRRRLLSSAAAAAAVIVLVPWSGGCARGDDVDARWPTLVEAEQPLRHGTSADASISGGSWSTSTLTRTPTEASKSFGVFVCLAYGESARIIAVEPVERIGDVRNLPAMIHTVGASEDPFISADGYPAHIPPDAVLAPISEGQFTFQCGDDRPLQHVVVGLEAQGPAGGGWLGVRIRYVVDGRAYFLEVPVGMLMCGETTEPCDDGTGQND
ncbi:hypothetical protein HF995_02370 [Sanguibacter hominis ATCC BAA-789]|uniref:Uncharacterized protein n=1 Tax=Sanguibacter hominis ATCC BAA-789 TaxID=1312740 RepID=A0A9X5F969_9MICO|nr:hypothetical protein [Sanguibacter hominis]NKX92126.1 hypothetical protein [Sanguibacter hominis ATCC BAA-789]